MLLNAPGSSATVLVALATSGVSPAPTSAGKVISVPPPAIAFTIPAARAAAATTSRRSRERAGGAGGTIWTPNLIAAPCGRRPTPCRGARQCRHAGPPDTFPIGRADALAETQHLQ